ncbi:MAG: hypothetical protein ACOX7F_04670 [Eubacteriales bacterium]
MKMTTGEWICWVVLAAALYVLPLLMQDTGSAMVLMLLAMPVTCLVCGGYLGWKRGFHLWYGLAVMVLFLPTIWIYYNSSAWVYGPAYGLLTLLGSGVGLGSRRTAKKEVQE